MLFMTWIARVGDGLPLAASIPEDEEVSVISGYFPSFRSTVKIAQLLLFTLRCLFCASDR